MEIRENTQRVSLGVGSASTLYYGARAYVNQQGDTAIITCSDKNGTTTATVKNGTNGTDGTDGIGIDSIDINADERLVITLSNGEVWESTMPIVGEKGADGSNASFNNVSATVDNNVGVPSATVVLTHPADEDGNEIRGLIDAQFNFVNIKGEKGDRGERGESGTGAVMDTELSDTSINGVENRVIKSALDGKADVDDIPSLTDYVKNTDYATTSNAGIVKMASAYGTNAYSDGSLSATTKTYQQYSSGSNGLFIGKGTLENVLANRIPTKTSDITNDSGFTTFSGSYNDLTNKPTIPSIDGLARTSDLSTVATSGSYNDLSDKPSTGYVSPTVVPSTDTTVGTSWVDVVDLTLSAGTWIILAQVSPKSAISSATTIYANISTTSKYDYAQVSHYVPASKHNRFQLVSIQSTTSEQTFRLNVMSSASVVLASNTIMKAIRIA